MSDSVGGSDGRKHPLEDLSWAIPEKSDGSDNCPKCKTKMEYVGTPDGNSGYLNCWACYEPTSRDRLLAEALVAVERVMLREQGTSWADEESDGPNFSDSDREYMREAAKSYVAAVDMILTDGLNAEQVEAVICDGEIISVR